VKEVLSQSRLSTTTLIRDDHVDGEYFVETKFNDDHSLEVNKKLRNEGFLAKAELGLHDNADIRYWISIPDPLQWTFFQRKYPEIVAMLRSKTDFMRGAKQLQILHPEWVIAERS